MKKKYLHEYTLRELLLEKKMEKYDDMTNISDDPNYENLMIGRPSPWSDERFPDRGFWGNLAAYVRNDVEEYEQYNDQQLEKLANSDTVWGDFFEFLKWEEHERPPIQEVFGKYGKPTKVDQHELIGVEIDPDEKDEFRKDFDDWYDMFAGFEQPNHPWRKFDQNMTAEKLFQQAGIDVNDADWAAVIETLKTSIESNKSEWLQDSVHLLSNMIGGSSKYFSTYVANTITTLGVPSAGPFIEGFLQSEIGSNLLMGTKVGSWMLAIQSLGYVAFVALCANIADTWLDERRNKKILDRLSDKEKAMLAQYMTKKLGDSNAMLKHKEHFIQAFTEVEHDLLGHLPVSYTHLRAHET